MRNFCLAAFLVLRVLLGNAENGEEEEITEFLYEYASHFSDYLYATVEYYTENITVIPTTYSYEEYQEYQESHESHESQESQESQESVGSPLQYHLPLIILLSLLRFLL